MRVYIVTKNDYRYVNGRFFPVDTFDTDIKYALNHKNIFVGVYDSLIAAEAAVNSLPWLSPPFRSEIHRSRDIQGYPGEARRVFRYLLFFRRSEQ